jgi:alpha-ribazole phosphatase
MKPLRFHWIRHAPPVNPDNICYGADMDVDLGDAAALVKQASLIPCGAEWIASPMSRAWKTANALIDQHSDRANIMLRIEPDLREQSFGDWVNLPRNSLPGQPGFAAYMADPENNAPPNGESLKNVAARVSSVIDTLIVRHKQGGDLCIVSHKGINRAALHHALGTPLKDTLKIASDPLSVTILEYDYKQWTLKHFNLKP